MGTVGWPIWTRSHTTDEVFPLDVRGPGGPVTEFTVAVTAVGAPHPTAGQFTDAVEDGDVVGVRVGTSRAQTPGTYWAWTRINGRVLPPVAFTLT